MKVSCVSLALSPLASILKLIVRKSQRLCISEIPFPCPSRQAKGHEARRTRRMKLVVICSSGAGVYVASYCPLCGEGEGILANHSPRLP